MAMSKGALISGDGGTVVAALSILGLQLHVQVCSQFAMVCQRSNLVLKTCSN